MIGYTTKAQRDADIARLEAELAKAKAAKVEPDLSEALRAYCEAYDNCPGGWNEPRRAGLIAAYPALHAALGAPAAPEPTPAEDEAMAREIAARYYDQIQPGLASRMRQGHADDQPSVVSSLAAMLAERRRAQGGAK